MPEDLSVLDKKKSHREPNSGRKADKKKTKNEKLQELTARQRNPKAFAINSVVRAERKFRRTQDLTTKKQHIPVVDRTPVEPPPIIIAIVGPPKVGKSTLIQCLIKNFAKMPLTEINGPVTLVSGKKRRITLMECNNDINSMIDIAKVADLVLLLIDASFGFEMEIFEFLNICQVHGMPRIMGVLTHLDMLKNQKLLKKVKKTLKRRFWTEVFSGAKLFYLSGLQYDEYLRNEVANLGRFISVMKFRPLLWRSTHPYLLADRIEDLTPPEVVRQNPATDRTVSLYGYVRGVPLNKACSVHIAGCGDFRILDVSALPDPCPLPDHLKRRSLGEKERLVYAPFSGVGGIVYDKDAVYVELGGSHSYAFKHKSDPESELVNTLLANQETLDTKMARSELQLFTGARPITASDLDRGLKEEVVNIDGRSRRKVLFPSEDADLNESDGENSEDDQSDDEAADSGHESLNSEPNTSRRAAGISAYKTKVTYDSDEDSSDDEEARPDDSAVESVPWAPRNHDILGPPKKKLKTSETSNVESKVKKAERKLMQSLGEDCDSGSDDDDLDIEAVKPRDDCEEEGVVYRSISTSRDQDIKDKISGALSWLEVSEQSASTSRDNKETKMEHESLQSGEEESDHEESVDEGSSEDSAEDNDDVEDSAVRWKTNLAQKAADAFLDRQSTTQNLWKLVYGKYNSKLTLAADVGEEQDGEASDDDVGGLFRVVDKRQRDQREMRDIQDGLDCARFAQPQTRDWAEADVRELIRDCFVTGKWAESEDAAELLRLDDDDGDLYGDFEDLENPSASVVTPSRDQGKPGGEGKPNPVKPMGDMSKKEAIAEKKRKLKARFDAEYDDNEAKSYYDDLKAEVDQQAQLNKSEFENVAENLRVQMEGYRAGLYVRVEIANVPCELITNFDPSYPLVVGGLLAGEENIGYIQVRAKKHRWHRKILKTMDPLIISLGWRRFQTMPVFAKFEDNMRHRYLKYTPNHVACMAHFWGPITPQNTGFLAVQDVSSTDKKPGFRIAVTGTVVELDKSAQVMKKLKLTGTPLKIYTKTAFIQGMFTSALEVARFEGAKLRTVSGIRGQIKKASKKPEGSFRATFEDKILLSDIVFCRTWYRVDLPNFYNPVTSLLLPRETKNQWRGMKTVGQLKRENNVHAEVSTDNFYTPIEREPKLFRPLTIPKALQRELPYAFKPKSGPSHPNKSIESQRIAVVMEPHEKKIATMMRMMKTSYKAKQDKMKEEMSERITKYKKMRDKDEERRLKKQKDVRKVVFKKMSQSEMKSKALAAKRGRR